MNREDIIRMAREVGLPHWYETEGIVNEALLIKFAALVAKHTLANIDPSSFMSWQEGYEAGKQAEREACAKWLEDVVDAPNWAKQIRARGQA